MTTTHTPGPWVIDANGDIISGQGAIAWLPDEPNRPKKNARLIAAAPAMRSALLECEVLLSEYPVILRMVREALKAAD